MQVELLYRQHGPALLQYLGRSFGQSAAAEDLLHETFLHALRDLNRLSEAASPRAWLFGIARNVGITAVRRRRHHSGLPDDIPAAIVAPSDPRVDHMRTAISRLPAAQREALELRLRDNLSYAEIAAVLAIPVGTVRSRLHHAVRRLRELMLREHGRQSDEL